MRRLLVLTYYLAPDPSPGARRISGLIEHLPEFGWQPVAVTWPDREGRPRGETVRETPSLGPLAVRWWRERNTAGAGPAKNDSAPVPGRLKTLLGPLKSLAIPDYEVTWSLAAAATAIALHRKEPFDALLSTSPPHSVQVAAALVQAATGLPWLADFRDLWTDYHYYPFDDRRRRLDRRVEQAAIRRAAEVVSVSPVQAEVLAGTHGRPVHTVLTGFSEAEARALGAGSSSAKNAVFRIVHAGQLYGGRRTPEPILEALAILVGEGALRRDEVRLDFYGQAEPHVDEFARKYGFADQLAQHGFVPRDEVLAAERASDLQLLLTWFHPEEAGVLPSKLFEYLAAGRPILACGVPNQASGPILSDTRGGWLVSDVDGAVRVLRDRIAAWREGRAFTADVAALRRYTQRGAAEQFARILDGMVDQPRTRS